MNAMAADPGWFAREHARSAARVWPALLASGVLHAAVLATQVVLPGFGAAPAALAAATRIEARLRFVATPPETLRREPPPPEPKRVLTRAPQAGETALVPERRPVPPPVAVPEAAPVEATPTAAEPAVAAAVAAAPPAWSPARYDADYLDNPPPPYPLLSRRRGESGEVLLEVRVRVDGRADAVEVVRSSGHPRLDRAASEAVSGWRFVPARSGDVAVVSTVRVPIAFGLRGEG